MTVASCPSCRESVTVPIDASSESIVRCPLCHEEFRLEEFLSQLPPPLIVVSPADESAEDPVLQWLEPAAPGAVGRPVVTSHERDEIPAFDFTPGSATETAETRVEGPARSGRGRRHPLGEMAKILAGALLAVPTAQLILWWVVPAGWKRDLFGIGPAASRVVPWVVPDQFHARDPIAAAEAPSRAGVVERSLQERRSIGQAAAEPNGSRDLNDPRTGADRADRFANGEPVRPEPPRSDTAAGGEPLVHGATSTSRRGVTVSGVRDAPQYGLDDLRGAVEEALQASVAWDMSPDQSPQSRQELTDQFYTAFARLGETVTFVFPGDPGARELAVAIHELLQSFSRQPNKLAMIGNRTAQWLDQTNRPNRGVFLFGTVKRIEPLGSLFVTQLELASRKQQALSIVSRVDPAPFYRPGDRILMLGAIIDNPADNLVGYEGHAGRVVMGSFPTSLEP
jgi:hypothetical protein